MPFWVKWPIACRIRPRSFIYPSAEPSWYRTKLPMNSSGLIGRYHLPAVAALREGYFFFFLCCSFQEPLSVCASFLGRWLTPE